MIKSVFKRISKTRFVQSAVADRADLSLFYQKPTPRIVVGLVIIGISYVIGWPAITVLGIIAAYTQKPLILVVGGPVTYVLSHLVFILGAYLAGAEYARAFFRWAARMAVEKMMD
jgi:hypothetical protein